MRGFVYVGLVSVLLLHFDFWLWNVEGRVLGLPPGLAYQISYCLVVVCWMAMLVKYAWPAGIDEDEDDRGEGDG